MTTCARCGREVGPDEAVRQGSRVLCEDCLMDEMSPAKACDPWAVRHARNSLGSGARAAWALRGLEKRLYDLVRERGSAPRSPGQGRARGAPPHTRKLVVISRSSSARFATVSEAAASSAAASALIRMPWAICWVPSRSICTLPVICSVAAAIC